MAVSQTDIHTASASVVCCPAERTAHPVLPLSVLHSVDVVHLEREIKGLHQALHPSPSMLRVALVLAALRGVAQSASRRNHDTTHTFVCICVCIVGMFTWACQTDFKVV